MAKIAIIGHVDNDKINLVKQKLRGICPSIIIIDELVTNDSIDLKPYQEQLLEYLADDFNRQKLEIPPFPIEQVEVKEQFVEKRPRKNWERRNDY